MEGSPYPFYRYSTYLEKRYGRPAYRIGIDGGFSCPNRGKTRYEGGCTYCDAEGSRATYTRRSDTRTIEEQIRRGREFLSARYKAETFLLYFQAFSSTYAPVQQLREIYDFGLSCGRFEELIVSTRPDCIDREKASLLGSYRERGLDVWVELGLQSVHERTLKRINRGHSVEEFFDAYRMLKEAGVKVGVHVIFGLPGEDRDDCMETIQELSRYRPDGIKIHNLHIQAGTSLASEYLGGEISVLSAARHLDYVIGALELLPPQTVILRLTCDTPEKRLLAPRNFPNKDVFYAQVAERMRERQTYQGRLFLRNV
ncbi:MAG TPA: TIGR01212 family radical SAM protein [Spirochaetia bacterium]|nr:TIGR01212 family radical SAM protein [Spirochaetia bacterium]